MKKRFVSEFLGTAFLLAIVVGSGIMGERLSQGNEAITLLVNSMATGAGLFAMIQCLGHVSGAHFNPVVSLVDFFWGRLDKVGLSIYWLAQFLGATLGVWSAHYMFYLPVLQISNKYRSGSHLWFSEFVATFGLICTIALSRKKNPEFAPFAIAAFITSAYWFTSSTSFANPAVTFARMLTDTFCGIAPSGVAPFVISQVLGALLASIVLKKVR